MFSSIAIRRLIGGVKWNSEECSGCVPIMRLHLHASSSSCHILIVQDDWWTAAIRLYF